MVVLLIIITLGLLLSLFSHLAALNPSKISLTLPFVEHILEGHIVIFLLGAFVLGSAFTVLAGIVKKVIAKLGGLPMVLKKKEKEKLRDVLFKGIDYFALGDNAKAIKCFEEYVEANPTDILAVNLIGDTYFRDGNISRALYFHKRASRLDPKKLVIQYKLLEDYIKLEKNKSAEKQAKTLITSDPHNIDNYRCLYNIFTKEDRFEEALDLQREIVKKVSGKEQRAEQKRLLEIQYEIGMEKLRAGEDQAALKMFKDIVRADKSFWVAVISLGDIYMNQKSYSNAAEIWSKGYAATKEPTFLSRLEKLYLAEEKPEEIIQLYKDVLVEDPSNISVFVMLCLLCLKLEMVDLAEDLLSKLESDKVNYPIMLYINAVLLEKKHKWKEAALAFKKTCNMENMPPKAYLCKCGYRTDEWSGRCPQCRSWQALKASYF